MAATSNAQYPDQSYQILDTGATDHCTPDASTIPDHQDYTSNDLATVGNGNTVPLIFSNYVKYFMSLLWLQTSYLLIVFVEIIIVVFFFMQINLKSRTYQRGNSSTEALVKMVCILSLESLNHCIIESLSHWIVFLLLKTVSLHFSPSQFHLKPGITVLVIQIHKYFNAFSLL